MEHKELEQAFRDPSTEKVVTIPVELDNGKPVIIWSHVVSAFPSAVGVMNREALVPFMVDDNLEMMLPQRILYQPGVELKVVSEVSGVNFSDIHQTKTIDKLPELEVASNLTESSTDSGPPSNQWFQEFWLASATEALSSSETVAIPARWDSKSGCHVVLWDDIQQFFKDVEYVVYDDLVVDFLKDPDGLRRLSPLRIKYHPDAILEVIDTNGAKDMDRYGQGTVDNATDSISELALGNIDSRTDSSLYVQIKERESMLEGMVPGQATSALIFRNMLDNLLKVAQLQMSEDEAIQNRLRNTKRLDDSINHVVRRYQHVLEDTVSTEQQIILDAQQKRIDSLAIFQDSVEKLATLAFALHNRLVPRLFIVVPRVLPFLKNQRDLSSDDFRLYFVCECYQWNADQEERSSGGIHLAMHGGYDIDKAQEFFEDYGSYVQGIHFILKNGITAPGIHIPRMTHLKLVEGVDRVQDRPSLTTDMIDPLMHGTDTFIQSLQSGKESINQETALEILEHADLQPLVQYLKDGHTLGNLYQGITAKGDVRWLCVEHHQHTALEHQEDHPFEADDVRDVEGEEFCDGHYPEASTDTIPRVFLVVPPLEDRFLSLYKTVRIIQPCQAPSIASGNWDSFHMTAHEGYTINYLRGLEHRHRDGIKRVSKATRYIMRGAGTAGNFVASSLLSLDYNVDNRARLNMAGIDPESMFADNRARLNMAGIDPESMFVLHIVADTHQRTAMEELLRGAAASKGQQNITGDLKGVVLGDGRTVWVCDQCRRHLQRGDPIGETDYLTLSHYIPLVKRESEVEATLCNATAIVVFNETLSRPSKTDNIIIRIDPTYFEAPERSTGARFNSVTNLFNELGQVLRGQKALRHLEIHANATTDGRVFAGLKAILKCRSLETLIVSGIPCFLQDDDLLIKCRRIKTLTLHGILVDTEQAADNLQMLVGMNPRMTDLMVTQARFTTISLDRLLGEGRQDLILARFEGTDQRLEELTLSDCSIFEESGRQSVIKWIRANRSRLRIRRRYHRESERM